jgi:hypothetical protein
MDEETVAAAPQGAIAPMPQISGESHYFSGLTWFESARQILWSVEK